MSTGTSITAINSMSAVELFQGSKIEELLDAITVEARSEVGDPSSEKGRAQIKSLAHKVAKSKTAIDSLGKVDCRVGSLEMTVTLTAPAIEVDCRIGSLEIKRLKLGGVLLVDCRIGSLEIL